MSASSESERLEDRLVGPTAFYELTLFVSGASDLAARAIANARHLCDAHLAGQHRLRVVDVHDDVAAAIGADVLATPTLVKDRPLPRRTIVGDLSTTDVVLHALGLPVARRVGELTPELVRRPHSVIPAERPPNAADGAARVSTGPGAENTLDLDRQSEAEELSRAIGGGDVDGLVVSAGGSGRQVFNLSTADRPSRMFVENMRDGAAIVSATGIIYFANRRFAELLARPRETIVGAPLSLFTSPSAATAPDDLLGPTGLGATVEFDLIDADGIAVPVRVGASPLEVDSEQVVCITFTDLTVQKAQERTIADLGHVQAKRMADLQDAQAALTKQATHDSLTGLPNRLLLVDRIDQALSRAKRSGRNAAILFIDLDRFKQINDSHGHAAGDIVLCRVADQLVAALRPMDTVARIGGDEFVVLAPEVDSRMHAVDIGTRLLNELCNGQGCIDDDKRVAASIGIAISRGGDGTAETLLNEADTAMYKAKTSGGERVGVFDEALGRQVKRRATALRMLRSALDDHRVIAYYQPIMDLRAGSVCGFEALARIAEVNGSVTPPDKFIPAAEDSGLVVPLGGQMLQLACQQAASWPAADEAYVAVNISPRQFEPGNLTSHVIAALETTGLDPARLRLEITETAILGLNADTLNQLKQMSDLGVQLGLDDFGTGYASLTHLRTLPLSFVKIDQSFVQRLDLDNDNDNGTGNGNGNANGNVRIVSAVVHLAANLGLRSIAEGVETPEQLHVLRELGCDQAQGYLFARPLPRTEVLAALQLRGPEHATGTVGRSLVKRQDEIAG
jgi:diguanylate cyclase (GGDEF)-like protein